MGPGRPVRAVPPATTSTTSRWPVRSLTSVAPAQPPTPPLNMVGDFGGGGMLLAFGVVCALLEAQRSGQGQVVDAAMVDGSAVLMTMFWTMQGTAACSTSTRAAPTCSTPAPTSTTCTSAPTASTSRSARSSRSSTPSCCGSPGSTATREFAKQIDTSAVADAQGSASPSCSATKTRDEWCALMEHTDVCFAPVLTMSEAAAASAQRRPRRRSSTSSASLQPAPAPRFSRTMPELAAPPAHAGAAHARGAADWGIDAADDADRRRCSRRPAPVEARPDGHAGRASTPTPTTRRSPPAGRWRARHAEGHRVVLVVATNGEHGEVPDDLADGRDARRPAPRRDRALGRRARRRSRRVARLRRHGHDRLGAEPPTSESFWQADVDEAAERLAAVLREESGRRADDLRLARQLRPSRSHQGAPGRSSRRRAVPATCPARCSRRR